MGSKHSEPASFQRRNASRRQANSTEKFKNLIAISERLGEMAHLFPNVNTKEIMTFTVALVPKENRSKNNVNVSRELRKNNSKPQNESIVVWSLETFLASPNNAPLNEAKQQMRHNHSTGTPIVEGGHEENRYSRSRSHSRSKKRKRRFRALGQNKVHPFDRTSLRMCPRQHVMEGVRGMPKSYAGKFDSVACDCCDRRDLALNGQRYWHCANCGYDSCNQCAKETEVRIVVDAISGTNYLETDHKLTSSRRNLMILTPTEFMALRKYILDGCSILSECVVATILNFRDRTTSAVANPELCEICFDSKTSVMLSCTHSFCESCLQSWMSRHNNCPMCRASIKKSSQFDTKQRGAWVLVDQDQDMIETGRNFLNCLWKLVKDLENSPALPYKAALQEHSVRTRTNSAYY